jgi:large conductance mechanosensitive channel
MTEIKTRSKAATGIIVKNVKKVKPFGGFFEFIRNHGVMSLAIGLFLGASLKTILDSLESNVVNPVIGVATGNINLASSSVCLKSVAKICTSKLNYGALVSSVIEFVLAAFVVYIIIKTLRLDKFDRKEGK